MNKKQILYLNFLLILTTNSLFAVKTRAQQAKPSCRKQGYSALREMAESAGLIRKGRSYLCGHCKSLLSTNTLQWGTHILTHHPKTFASLDPLTKKIIVDIRKKNDKSRENSLDRIIRRINKLEDGK